jgi:hypothetical protein
VEEACVHGEGVVVAKGKPGPGKKYAPWLGFRPGLKRRDDMTEVSTCTQCGKQFSGEILEDFMVPGYYCSDECLSAAVADYDEQEQPK